MLHQRVPKPKLSRAFQDQGPSETLPQDGSTGHHGLTPKSSMKNGATLTKFGKLQIAIKPHVIHKKYPLVNQQFAIEHGPVEIVDLPVKHGGSFHSCGTVQPEGEPPFFHFPIGFPMCSLCFPIFHN